MNPAVYGAQIFTTVCYATFRNMSPFRHQFWGLESVYQKNRQSNIPAQNGEKFGSARNAEFDTN